MVWVWIPVVLFTSPLSAKLPHLHLLIILGIDSRDTLKAKIIETENRPQWISKLSLLSSRMAHFGERKWDLITGGVWYFIGLSEFWVITYNEIWIICKIHQSGSQGEHLCKFKAPTRKELQKFKTHCCCERANERPKLRVHYLPSQTHSHPFSLAVVIPFLFFRVIFHILHILPQLYPQPFLRQGVAKLVRLSSNLILLPQSTTSLDYRHAPPHPAVSPSLKWEWYFLPGIVVRMIKFELIFVKLSRV